MTYKSLEEKLQAAGNPVDMARNSQIGPYVYPGVPSEFSNWMDEQVAWRETSALFDQTHHMTDLYVEGPDVVKLFSALGVNTFENFQVGKAKQFVAVIVLILGIGGLVGLRMLAYLEGAVERTRGPGGPR